MHACVCVCAVKGVNFFGLRSEYVVSGSDCGHVFLWDTDRQDIVQCMEGDMEGVVSASFFFTMYSACNAYGMYFSFLLLW